MTLGVGDTVGLMGSASKQAGGDAVTLDESSSILQIALLGSVPTA